MVFIIIVKTIFNWAPYSQLTAEYALLNK